MPRSSDGIDAFRRLIPRLWIDREKCGEAFETLKSYHAEWDQQTQTLAKSPKHDFSSNFADSCRYFAITPDRSQDSWTELDYSNANKATNSGRGYARAK
jgi:hypothetical protein